MRRNALLAFIGLAGFSVAVAISAAPSPNNCGLNMLCRVRTLIVTGSATVTGNATMTGALSVGHLDAGTIASAGDIGIPIDNELCLDGLSTCAKHINGTDDQIHIEGDANDVLTVGIPASLDSDKANYVQVAGGTAGNPVTIMAFGETNVDINVVPKGSGSVKVSGALVAIFSGASNTNKMLCGGETTLSGGTGSGDFTDASCTDFGASPMCIVSGQTAFCGLTGISTSAVTLGGTGADKCNWLCFGTAP